MTVYFAPVLGRILNIEHNHILLCAVGSLGNNPKRYYPCPAYFNIGSNTMTVFQRLFTSLYAAQTENQIKTGGVSSTISHVMPLGLVPHVSLFHPPFKYVLTDATDDATMNTNQDNIDAVDWNPDAVINCDESLTAQLVGFLYIQPE